MTSDVEIAVSAGLVLASKRSSRRRDHPLEGDGVGTMAIAGRLALPSRRSGADPKPFVWTADSNRILEGVRRGHQTLETIQ